MNAYSLNQVPSGSRPPWGTSLLVLMLAGFLGGTTCAQHLPSLKWTIKTLAIDSNEGIDLADFNGDGQIDVTAGRNWYAAPDFAPRPLRTIEDWNDYVLSNGDFAYDVNGDGRVDVISGAFNLPEVNWYENPGEPRLSMGKIWQKHLLIETGESTNEGQLLYDIDGDGTPEWVVSSWTKDLPLVAWRFSTGQPAGPGPSGETVSMVSATRIEIGSNRNGHGLGFGDLNGDDREDLVFEGGWYEAPAGRVFAQPWKLHNDWEIQASLPILVRDLNDDGRNDIIVGIAHDYGLFWWEQLAPQPEGKLKWDEHLIDDSFSQPHSLHLADLDQDGTEELIVGKRVLAHNGNDPGGTDPPCIFYYKWDGARQEFSKHVINEGRVGAGLQIRTADLNGDGRTDIAVAGKSGTYILFNEGM
jgi:hypothetical protein